jgi:5-formyltetrahydrofolate cyclo-ligase
MKTDRPALRKNFRKTRSALSSQSRERFERAIVQHLSSFVAVSNAAAVAVYLAADGEVDLAAWVQHAWQRGKTLGLPCIDDSPGEMQFCDYRASSELSPNRFRIMQPNNAKPIDNFGCVLAPLVAFDDHGTRLGMGGGYYDRYLAATDSAIIGVAFSCQKSHVPIPREDWDVPLDAIVTELGVVEF